MKSKGLVVKTLGIGLLTLTMGSANAWHVDGNVLCDVNGSGGIDIADRPLSDFGFPDVEVNVVNSGGYRRLLLHRVARSCG